MYGYKNPGFAPAYGAGPAYPMARHAGHGMSAFGAEEKTFSQKATDFFDAPGPLNVSTNKMWLGAAVVGAGIWWYVANR